MNCQQTSNALTTQKSVAVYFKDVKTEEKFSSQDQKLVETTNFIETKNSPAQIRQCNDHYPSRIEYMNKNEHIKKIISARHCDQKWNHL